MHFYSMPVDVVMDLPLYTFWEMSHNVGRISAEQDMRMMAIVSSAFGGGQKLANHLESERGEVVEFEKEFKHGFDKSGFIRLRAMMGG